MPHVAWSSKNTKSPPGRSNQTKIEVEPGFSLERSGPVSQQPNTQANKHLNKRPGRVQKPQKTPQRHIASVQKRRALEIKLKQNPDHVPTREDLADLYYKSKNHKKVVVVLAPYSNEIGFDSVMLLSDSYAQLKKWDANIALLERLIQKTTPPRFRPYFLLAKALLQKGNQDEAAKNLEQATLLAPKHLPSFRMLVEFYEEQKNWFAQRSLILNAMKAMGPRGEFLNALCSAQTQAKLVKESILACKRAIKKTPSYEPNYIDLAYGLAYQGKTAQAEKVLTQAAKKFKGSEFIQWSVGEFFFSQKNFMVAIRFLKNAVQNKPNSARGHLALAISLFQGAFYKDALKHYMLACKYEDSGPQKSLEEFRTALAKLSTLSQTDPELLSMLSAYTKQEARCVKAQP